MKYDATEIAKIWVRKFSFIVIDKSHLSSMALANNP